MDYRPTMIDLTHVINIVAKELIGTIKSMSRMRDALGDACAKKSGVVVVPNVATGNSIPGVPTASSGDEASKHATGERKISVGGADSIPLSQVPTCDAGMRDYLKL